MNAAATNERPKLPVSGNSSEGVLSENLRQHDLADKQPTDRK